MIRYIIALAIGVTSILRAGWNEQFDKQSQWLIGEIPEFQGKYQESYATFAEIRTALLKDFLLNKQIAASLEDQRMVLLRPRDGLVIKKRANNNIYELFAWELSYIFHGEEFLVGSFPLEVSGKRIIVQQMEPFFFKKEYVMEAAPKEVKKVTVEEYWKSHLLAYLLGLADLVGQNIGVNPLGHVRFFDMEASLQYNNKPHRTTKSFKPGFVSQSLEWPQYRMPLDKKTAARLQKFVASLDRVEENLNKYIACRKVSVHLDGMLFRLNKVRDFLIKEGRTFRDFYGFIFPQIDPGLDELSAIASDILKKKIDHGSSLILICRWIDRYNLSGAQKQAIENWIATYIDEQSSL
jgi:hypothetical protein